MQRCPPCPLWDSLRVSERPEYGYLVFHQDLGIEPGAMAPMRILEAPRVFAIQHEQLPSFLVEFLNTETGLVDLGDHGTFQLAGVDTLIWPNMVLFRRTCDHVVVRNAWGEKVIDACNGDPPCQ